MKNLKIIILLVIQFTSCGENQQDIKNEYSLSAQTDTINDKVKNRLLDSLNNYMLRENARWESHPELLKYSIWFDTTENNEIEVNFAVSNVHPGIDSSKAKFIGYFIFRDAQVIIADRVPPAADSIYNSLKLKKYIEPKGGEPPGSGYVGEEFQFIW